MYADIIIGANYYELLLKDKRYFVSNVVFRGFVFRFVISESHLKSINFPITYCFPLEVDPFDQLGGVC